MPLSGAITGAMVYRFVFREQLVMLEKMLMAMAWFDFYPGEIDTSRKKKSNNSRSCAIFAILLSRRAGIECELGDETFCTQVSRINVRTTIDIPHRVHPTRAWRAD